MYGTKIAMCTFSPCKTEGARQIYLLVFLVSSGSTARPRHITGHLLCMPGTPLVALETVNDTGSVDLTRVCFPI